MSRSSHFARSASVLGLTSAAFLATAAAAEASPTTVPLPPFSVDKTLNLQCKWPLVAPGTIRLQITGTRTPLTEQSERWDLNATATLEAPTPYALRNVRALAAFDGKVRLKLDGWESDGDAVASKVVDLMQPRTPFLQAQSGDETRELNFSGSIPEWTVDDDPLARVALAATPQFTLRASDADGAALKLPPVSKDWNNEPYAETDQDVETFDLVCRLNPNLPTQSSDLWVAGSPAVSFPPSKPTDLESASGPGEISLRWAASTDPDGAVVQYRVFQGGSTTPVKTVTGTSATISGLAFNTEYSFTVAAVDDKGLQGQMSDPVVVKTTGEDIPLPTPIVVAVPGDRQVTLNWTPSVELNGVNQYKVYQDGALAKTVPGGTTTTTITGLTNDQEYSFNVSAIDDEGREGPKSNPAIATPRASQPVLVEQSYSLAGSAQIKTLSRGTLPISGGIDASLDVETGLIEADLRLNQTSGRLTALGFLPVTAKIGFAPSGKTTGSLREGSLETRSLVRIKVQEVKLFGAIPLAGGNSCQTKSLSEIKLKNTQEFFDYTVGGPIAGTFAISDLNGCGVLNGLVSPLTAGGGNTLRLALAPKATTGG